MASSERFSAAVLGHITDIANGCCTLSDADITAENDPLASEILAGLMMLAEELAERERERAEAERRSLELSTPVLEVGRGVVLMPLVGIVDFARSEQMVERALQAISDKRARVLVIDVTGVADLDERIAERLLSTVRAVGLLGARTILTGVSPSNAQILVQLELSLDTLTIRRNLGSGLEAAFTMAR